MTSKRAATMKDVAKQAGEGGEKGIMSVGDDQSHQIAPLRFKTPCISVYLIMKLLDGVLDLDSV